MTESMAIEIAKGMMREMGFNENYSLRFHHFDIKPLSKKVIKSFNYLYIITGNPEDVKIYSQRGFYDLSDDKVNNQQHIHSGVITLINEDHAHAVTLKLLQVIPH